MDKTLEIVVAAAVIVVIGAIAGYLVNTEATSFSNFIGTQTDRAECQKYQGDDREAFQQNNCQEILGETFEEQESGSGVGTCSSGQRWCQNRGSCIDESSWSAGMCGL